MGGRTEKPRISESGTWITEVSDTRLESYSRLTVSGGFGSRATGDSRSHDQQLYFRDLVSKEKTRRGLK